MKKLLFLSLLFFFSCTRYVYVPVSDLSKMCEDSIKGSVGLMPFGYYPKDTLYIKPFYSMPVYEGLPNLHFNMPTYGGDPNFHSCMPTMGLDGVLHHCPIHSLKLVADDSIVIYSDKGKIYDPKEFNGFVDSLMSSDYGIIKKGRIQSVIKD